MISYSFHVLPYSDYQNLIYKEYDSSIKVQNLSLNKVFHINIIFKFIKDDDSNYSRVKIQSVSNTK